jgi:hypothetical protein
VEGESNSGERAQIMRQIYMTRSEFEYPPPRSLLIPGAEPTSHYLIPGSRLHYFRVADDSAGATTRENIRKSAALICRP